MNAAEAEPKRAPAARRLRPLASLLPYLARYRGRAFAALLALLAAALATLAVPIAVRRMIDFGFSAEGVALIDSYFLVMIAVAGVLAAASALRYYLVTTLGERIVADLREDVFAHLIRLSADFFDQAKTGEMISRLTADTTQIKAAVGASVSIALRNMVLFVGRRQHDGDHQPTAVGFRAGARFRSSCCRWWPSGARCGGAHARRRTLWRMPRPMRRRRWGRRASCRPSLTKAWCAAVSPPRWSRPFAQRWNRRAHGRC